MKVRRIENIYNGPVNAKSKVILEITKEQSEELRQALKLIDRYKDEAIRALKYKAEIKGADWNMFGYAVKNDCVVVEVQVGACG